MRQCQIPSTPSSVEQDHVLLLAGSHQNCSSCEMDERSSNSQIPGLPDKWQFLSFLMKRVYLSTYNKSVI